MFRYHNSDNSNVFYSRLFGKEIDVEYNRKNIIDKINSYFGYSFINSIQIKIISTKFTSPTKTKVLKKYKNKFDNNLKKIDNNNLKRKLESLINAYNEKK